MNIEETHDKLLTWLEAQIKGLTEIRSHLIRYDVSKYYEDPDFINAIKEGDIVLVRNFHVKNKLTGLEHLSKRDLIALCKHFKIGYYMLMKKSDMCIELAEKPWRNVELKD